MSGLASPHTFLSATPLAGGKGGSGECGLLPGCSSWWATWSGLASSGCWVASVVCGNAVFSLVPSYSEASGAGAHRVPVMDVPVIMQLKFLQYYENVELPQIPSSTECIRFQLYYRGEYVQCKLCSSGRFHSAVLWEGCSPARCSCDDRRWCWSRQCRNSSRYRRRSSGESCRYAAGVQKLRGLRSYSSSTTLVHVPVVMQRLVPTVQTVQLGLEAWAAHYLDDELWFF